MEERIWLPVGVLADTTSVTLRVAATQLQMHQAV
jgi:hypothetical protein